MIYLVHYDRSTANLVRIREFLPSERLEAEETRLADELQLLAAKKPYEIVLLEASSQGELRKTHRRYFEGLDDLLKGDPIPCET